MVSPLISVLIKIVREIDKRGREGKRKKEIKE